MKSLPNPSRYQTATTWSNFLAAEQATGVNCVTIVSVVITVGLSSTADDALFTRSRLLPSPRPPLSERRTYCYSRRLCVCVSAEPPLYAALASAAKVMRCIRCSLVRHAVVVCRRRQWLVLLDCLWYWQSCCWGRSSDVRSLKTTRKYNCTTESLQRNHCSRMSYTIPGRFLPRCMCIARYCYRKSSVRLSVCLSVRWWRWGTVAV